MTRFSTKVCLVLSALGLPAALASAQAPAGDPAPVYHGRSGNVAVAPPRIRAAIRIDGLLDESAWRSAALLTGFSQYSPVDGAPAADSTEVLVMYADHSLYFGIRAFESHGPVTAVLADRDRINTDDHVRLILDTFNDRRRALVFATNPRGVQSDGTLTDNASGGAVDLNPDFVFESRGRLTDQGYEVEVRIPLKSLRYAQGSEQRWGLNIVRVVQHAGHEQTWTRVTREIPSFLGQSGTLQGMRDLRPGLVLDLNPVVTQQTIGTDEPGRGWSYEGDAPELSGNIRWGVTPNLSVNATINPDFSQVEADVGQVLYDPRAALFLAEKRPFFLEGSEHFDVPNTLIYTRSILSPTWAAKAAGKVGRTAIGILSAQDDRRTSASGSDQPVFNILRIKRDVGAQSSAGFLYTERREVRRANRVVGADARAYAGRWVAIAQLASSITSDPATGDDNSGALFEINVARPGRTRGFSAVLEATTPDFAADAGFVSRPGTARLNLGPRWTTFPASGRIESLSFTPAFDGTWDWDRFAAGTEPNDMKFFTHTTVSWRGGWRTGLSTFIESFLYPEQLYRNYYIERRNDAGVVTDTVPYTGTHRLPNYGFDLQVVTPQFQRFSASASVVAGHDDNFDEWSSAWILNSTLNLDWRAGDRLRVNARYVQQRVHRVSDRSLVRLRTVPRLKAEYQISRPWFVRVVTQYDATKVDSLRDDSRTNFPILLHNGDGTFRRAIARQSAGLRLDALVSYQPTPGTVFFAGYGSSYGSLAFGELSSLDRTSDAFFVKASYLFRM